jgi:hypothetical protein
MPGYGWTAPLRMRSIILLEPVQVLIFYESRLQGRNS